MKVKQDDKAVIVIPARYASTRFPAKPLAQIAGKSLIQRVWENAKKVRGIADVFVATDEAKISDHCRSFGASVIMTSPKCKNGTERVYEASTKSNMDATIYVNLQGDSPLTPPWVIEALIEPMRRDAQVIIATPAVKLEGKDAQELVKLKKEGDSGIVTLVTDKNGNALYFSRSLIPYPKNPGHFLRHVGLYAYTTEALKEVVSLPPSSLELSEELEQLRFLEAALPVQVVAVDYKGRTEWEVNFPQDVAKVEEIIKREGEF